MLTDKQRRLIQDLRRQGYTADDVAANLGLPVEDVKPLIREAMQHLAANVESLPVEVALELSRIDHMLQATYPAAISGDIKATETVLKLMERKARLRGMDAPTRAINATVLSSLSDQELLEEAQRLGISTQSLKALQYSPTPVDEWTDRT